MSAPVEQGGKAAEVFFASLTGATVLGVLHWVLGIPAAAYYALKFYRLYKNKKATE
jgi:hypothetical protein